MIAEHDAALPPSRTSSIHSQFSETGSIYYSADRDTNGTIWMLIVVMKICFDCARVLIFVLGNAMPIAKPSTHFFLLLIVTMAASRPPRISPGLLLASQTSTPQLTPPASPPSYSASTSPTKTSKPVSPRRHSMSFATSRGMFDDRTSLPSSHQGSMSGSEYG